MPKNNQLFDIWFWQLIISPHMAGLLLALAKNGFSIRCIASQAMSSDRSSQGWVPPALPGIRIDWIDNEKAVEKLVRTAKANSVHICQGIRANGLISLAQKLLAEQGLKQFSIMETVEDSGWRGLAKRAVYTYLFRKKRNLLAGVLCIGEGTASWVKARGVPAEKIYPFTYFLSNQISSRRFEEKCATTNIFKFVYVGQLIPRKRVDMLIDALVGISDQSFEFWIVGAGPEEKYLKELANKTLKDRVHWFGQLPMSEVPLVVSKADCLVLPSIHDGWGAVCSEALMVGTPVICSNKCGASGVVRESNVGGVFLSEDKCHLQHLLLNCLGAGYIDQNSRIKISNWAQSLGANAGAYYLIEILKGVKRPLPPWNQSVKTRSEINGVL